MGESQKSECPLGCPISARDLGLNPAPSTSPQRSGSGHSRGLRSVPQQEEHRSEDRCHSRKSRNRGRGSRSLTNHLTLSHAGLPLTKSRRAAKDLSYARWTPSANGRVRPIKKRRICQCLSEVPQDHPGCRGATLTNPPSANFRPLSLRRLVRETKASDMV